MMSKDREMYNPIDEIAMLETSAIMDSKLFPRSLEKTQVNVPQNGLAEVAKNRFSHSFEVANSSLMIAASLAKKHNLSLNDIDYQRALYNVSLLHDLGLSCFGHDGSAYINDLFITQGLMEGFDDNSNNLVAIENNNIKVRPYVMASVIKYPSKLYKSQSHYLDLLRECNLTDTAHYNALGINVSKSSRTIACQIMDEADRNSYTTSDMSDYLCLAGRKVPSIEQIESIAATFTLSPLYQCEVSMRLNPVIQSGSKTIIKAYFSELKNTLNKNYDFFECGLKMVDTDLTNYREFINCLTKIFYIQPIRKLPFHQSNMEKLRVIALKMLDGSFLPSKHYRAKILSADNELDRLRYTRDMLAEVSDWYIIKMYDEFISQDLSSSPVD
jgi:dGTP triphosphohydrolase